MSIKINKKQILKNYQDDKDYSCTWEKTLRYADKKNIPFEHIFAQIAFENKSIKGLPYFLILSGRINDVNYMYEGISISTIFEMFKNFNKIENPFLATGGSFKVDSNLVSKDNLKKILLSIKDLEVLKPIIKENKELVFDKFKDVLSYHSYEMNFSNFVLYSYLNGDTDIVRTILFDIDLSSRDADQLIYESYFQESTDSLLGRIIMNGDIELLKEIDEKYNIDLSKSKSISSLFKSLFYQSNYPMKKIVSDADKFDVLDFMISKNIDSFIDVLRKTEDRFVSRYRKLAETFRNVLKNSKESQNQKFFNYFLKNTETKTNDYFFWSLVFINDFDFIKINFSNYTKSEKEELFILTSSTLNYDVLSLFLKDGSFDLNKKVNEEIAIYRFISKLNSKTELLERVKISAKFLSAGSRMNNINRACFDLERILRSNRTLLKNEDEAISSLFERYSNNTEELITFDFKITRNKLNDPFGYIEDIMSQLKDILLKKAIYKSIDSIMFIKKDKNNIFFLIDSELIMIPEENISGNEFTEKSFTKVK